MLKTPGLPMLMLLLSLAGAAAAQHGDVLRSPACLQALEALQAEAMAARPAGAASTGVQGDSPSLARIRARQKFAASACLGASMDAPPQASRSYQPPIVVPPVSGRTAHAPPLGVIAPAAGPTAHPALKPSIISCDAGGCMTSDGQRLQRVGGVLLGPNGLCNAQVPGQVCP